MPAPGPIVDVQYPGAGVPCAGARTPWVAMRSDDGVGAWPGDSGAERLYAAVCEVCRGDADLPARLEAALRAALEMLAADPELAWQLTVSPYMGDDENELDALRSWMARFGDLLLDAVESDPRTTSSRLPFLATFLIGGVRFQIGRLVLNHEAADLPRLLPSLLEGLLTFYFEPGEPQVLADAALGGP